MPSDRRSTLRHVLAALEGAGDHAYIWNLASDALHWHGAAPTDLGVSDPTALASGRALAERIHPEDREARTRRLDGHVVRGESLECEYRLVGDNGEVIWVQDRGTAEFDLQGRLKRLVGVVRRITDRKVAEQRLEQLANYDELTGHFNRGRLKQALDQVLAASLRTGLTGAYLAVDIDRLSAINDAFGYEVADQVIVEVAQRLDRYVRHSDVIGRVGGNRFGIVLTNSADDGVTIAAEKIIALIGQTPISTRVGPIYATVSVGGATFPDQAKTAYEVMTRAETALAEAKRAGRDCFIPYRVVEGQRRQHRIDMALGERVHNALRSNRLVFAYQPVIDVDGGGVECYECLLRMRTEDGSIVPASAFVPVIEQLGFIRLVDRYVLELAVREVESNPGVTLGFNISAFTASDRAWLRLVVSLLKDKPEVARRLIIEITETAALHDVEESAKFVRALKELGCRVALDDFGAGFTSLGHLQVLPVDIVKIDGAFVRRLTESYDNQVFLRHLVGLATGFNLVTVAECVENATEAAILSREGVHFLQGYYFGRPSVDKPWLQLMASREIGGEIKIASAAAS
jgi:diguanylate cyclase (GGDEF)-like protein